MEGTMSKIRWTEEIKKSVRTRIKRGTSPKELKRSFSAMVDSMSSPVSEVESLRAELRRLRAQLKSNPRP
jgi:polyhydroxyalkanoate synthesis regulator phasin